MANNSFTDCLLAAGYKFKGSEEARAKALRDFEAAYSNERQAGKSDFEATGNAAQRLVDRQTFETSSKANAVLRALDARHRIEQVIEQKGKRPIQAVIDELNKVNADIGQVAGTQLAAIEQFFKRFTTGETAFNKTAGGLLTNQTDRDLFGRAKFGEDVKSPEHEKLADQVSVAEENDRVRANNAGAAILKKKQYGLSTEHDAAAIQQAGKVRFVEAISRDLDLNHSYDGNGRALATLTPEELKAFHDEAYKNITSEGLIKSPARGGGSLAENMQQTRHYSFKSYDGWKAYNKEFGMSRGDPVNAVEAHFNSMARDIAMLERFGPNPRAMISYAKSFALEQAGKLHAAAEDTRTGPLTLKQKVGEKISGGMVGNAQRDAVRVDGVLNELMGKKNPLNLWAAGYGTARNLLVYPPIMAKAFIAQATGDVLARQTNMRMLNGLPAMGLLGNIFHWMRDMSSSDRTQLAIRLGLGTQDMMKSLRSMTFSTEHPIYSFSGAVSSGIGRAFLVHHHMESLPRTFGADMLGFMAQHRELDFGALEKKFPAFAESMQRNGIASGDWETFRKTPVTKFSGAEFLNPLDARNLDADVGKKFGAFVNSQARETVPASNPNTRYGLYGVMNPNTLPGMVMRDATTAMYFGASTLQMLVKGFALRQGVLSKGRYLGAMGVALAISTATQLQVKALLAGRDPYDMNPENETGRNFWADVSKRAAFGGPAYDMIMGSEPGQSQQGRGVFGKLSETAAILRGGTANELSGKEPKSPASAKLFNLYRHSLPGADGWYTQAFIQHGMLDALQSETDPQAYAEWQRSNQFYQRNYGQKSWWGRGSFAPERAPDLSSAYQR